LPATYGDFRTWKIDRLISVFCIDRSGGRKDDVAHPEAEGETGQLFLVYDMDLGLAEKVVYTTTFHIGETGF